MSFKITRDELEEEVFKTSEMEFSNIMKMLLKRRRIDNMVALSGSSHPELGNIVSKLTKIPLVSHVSEKFSNTEIRLEIKDNVRNRDMLIFQTGSYNIETGYSVNDNLMETMIMIDACRRSGVKSITLIMPCYPYARQDKKDESRAPISSKLVANMLTMAGIDRLIVMDLHASQIQGFFDIPVDNIYSINLLMNHLNNTYFKGMSIEDRQERFILVAPDAGAAKRTLKFGSVMNLNAVIMHKERNYKRKNTINKTVLICESDTIVGKTAIICDDMCDTAGTMVKAVNTLIENGARDVICAITHGIFSGPALERINKCDSIKSVIVSNSLPQEYNMKRCDKIECYDISPLVGDVIHCIGTGDSISELFLTK